MMKRMTVTFSTVIEAENWSGHDRREFNVEFDSTKTLTGVDLMRLNDLMEYAHSINKLQGFDIAYTVGKMIEQDLSRPAETFTACQQDLDDLDLLSWKLEVKVRYARLPT